MILPRVKASIESPTVPLTADNLMTLIGGDKPVSSGAVVTPRSSLGVSAAVPYTHPRAHETKANFGCRPPSEKKKKK